MMRNKNRINTQILRTLDRLDQRLNSIQQQLGQQQPGQPSIQQQLKQQQQDLHAIQRQLGQQQPGQPSIQQQLQQILLAISQQQGLQQQKQPVIQQQQGQVHQAPLTQNDVREMINKGIAKDKLESYDYCELQSYQYIKSNFFDFRYSQIKLFFDGLITDLNQQNHTQIPLPARNDNRSLKSYLRYLDSIWPEIQPHLMHPPQLITDISKQL